MGTKINLSALLSKSWDDMKPFYWQGVLAGLVTSVVFSAANSFLPLIGTILVLPLNIGLAMFYLGGVKTGTANCSTAFEAFNDYGKNFPAALHILGIPFLFNLLCFIPGIYFSLRYLQAFYILIEEPGLTSSEAIEKSGRLMDGHMWQGLGYLLLMYLAMVIVCIFTFGLGNIFLAPLFGTFFANYYVQLKEEYEERMCLQGAPAAAE